MTNRRGFDFDRWARLARSDPERFEAQRRAAIDSLIDEAPEECQRRLSGLQFRIDMERRRSGTPFAPVFIGDPKAKPRLHPPPPARVIPLQPRRPERTR